MCLCFLSQEFRRICYEISISEFCSSFPRPRSLGLISLFLMQYNIWCLLTLNLEIEKNFTISNMLEANHLLCCKFLGAESTEEPLDSNFVKFLKNFKIQWKCIDLNDLLMFIVIVLDHELGVGLVEHEHGRAGSALCLQTSFWIIQSHFVKWIVLS